MNYNKGTILFVLNTEFEDSKIMDVTGHPGMIPIASNDETNETYYLLLTSQIQRYLIYSNEYYDLTSGWQAVNLRKPSLIDLRFVYKAKISGKPFGCLSTSVYSEILTKFKSYQEKHPCNLYPEVKDFL